MAKDYFQDIIPPASSNGRKSRPVGIKRSVRAETPVTHDDPAPDVDSDAYLDDEPIQEEKEELREEVGLRGIRNINIPTRSRSRSAPEIRDMRQSPPFMSGAPAGARGTSSSRLWIWIIAGVCVLALGLFLILSMRPTVITVTPRSHAIVFDQTAEFVAYPDTTAASGTLPYTVETIDLNDSDIIPSQSGTTHIETKASATVTVHNAYSTSPVRLVATTRFETPDHLIFRTPSDIVIPAKKGNTPGSVEVTIVADQAGEQYNTPATIHFTLPGLQKNAPMFKGVYADSSGPITGGFAGDRAATDPAARATAVASIRTRLQEAALKKATADEGANGSVFFDLAQTTFQDLPDTNETNGVGIHERIHTLVPVLPADLFAQMVGSSVSSDVENASVKLVGGDGFGAVSSDEASSTLGTAPFHFRPTGNATLVWNVDTMILATALAGRDQASFKTIIANFPGIEAAHARIEPFWKNTFPTDPKAIKITITAPQPTTGKGN